MNLYIVIYIISGNFQDNYFNLTIKHIFGLKWIASYCSHAKYVLKADHDAIVNIPLLRKIINISPLRRSIVGGGANG